MPVPLCQRPASHTEQLSSLLQWRQDVLQEIQGIRDSFATTDGGPTAAELQVTQQQQHCMQLWVIRMVLLLW